MAEINHLLIAFSSGFTNKASYEKVVAKVLTNRTPQKITCVNDERNFVKNDPRFTETKISPAKCRAKIEARRLAASASHIICFWSGEDINDLIWEGRHQKIPLRVSTFFVTRAVNRDAGDAFDIYIGRSGPWGNPFPIIPGTDQTRERVIERYEEYFKDTILSDPSKHKALLALRGLRLGCHCKPLACHGDVIARYLNNYRDPDESSTDDEDQMQSKPPNNSGS